MIELAGNVLNWFASGVLFPLLLLPVAALATEKRIASSWMVFLLGVAVTGGGLLFAIITPVLRITPNYSGFLAIELMFFVVALIVLAIGGAGKAAAHLAPLLSAITRIVGRTVMWLLLIMALLQFAIVLMRYVFGVNEIFMQESITYMHGAVFLLAAGYALLTNDHVRVDIFYRDASPKRKAMVDLLGTYLFLFPICLVILWTSSPYVARSWAFFEGSADTSGIQGVFLLKSLIPAFAVLLAMAGFVVAHKAVETLKAGK